MSIHARIRALRQRIDEATRKAGRLDRVCVQLAVKTRSAHECAAAAQALIDLGLPPLLGHNRVQEAVSTSDAIHAVEGARVHLIGPLQSNKVTHALRSVDGIDSLHRIDLVQRLARRLSAEEVRTPFPVLIQVNVSGEESKSGVLPEAAPALVDEVLSHPELHFSGFMTIGAHRTEEAYVRKGYAHLRLLRERTAERIGVAEEALTLSMGMSGDLEWAIAEGATLVRAGTAVFGPRLASANESGSTHP